MGRKCYSIYADISGKQGRGVEGSEMEGSNRAICPITQPEGLEWGSCHDANRDFGGGGGGGEEGFRCVFLLSKKSANVRRGGITTRRRRGVGQGDREVKRVLTFKPWLVNGPILVQPCADCRDSCASKKGPPVGSKPGVCQPRCIKA